MNIFRSEFTRARVNKRAVSVVRAGGCDGFRAHTWRVCAVILGARAFTLYAALMAFSDEAIDLPDDVVRLIVHHYLAGLRARIANRAAAVRIQCQMRVRLFRHRVLSFCGEGCGDCYACVAANMTHLCQKPWRPHMDWLVPGEIPLPLGAWCA